MTTHVFHPLYCYEPCQTCGVRGRHRCTDGLDRLSNLNPGRYGEQHHPPGDESQTSAPVDDPPDASFSTPSAQHVTVPEP